MPSDWTFAAVRRLDERINNTLEYIDRVRDGHNTSIDKVDEVVGALNGLKKDFAERDTLKKGLTIGEIRDEFTTASREIHDHWARQAHQVARASFTSHTQRSGVSIAPTRLQELSDDLAKLFDKQKPTETAQPTTGTPEEKIDHSFLLNTVRYHSVVRELAACTAVNNMRDAYNDVMHAELAATQAKDHEQTHGRLRGVNEAIADLRQNRTEQALELRAAKDKLRAHSQLLDDEAGIISGVAERLWKLEDFAGITDTAAGEASSSTPHVDEEPEVFHDAPSEPPKSLTLQLAGIQRTLTLVHNSLEKLQHKVHQCETQNFDMDRRLRQVETLVRPDETKQALTQQASTSGINHVRPFDRFEEHVRNHPPKWAGLPSPFPPRAALTKSESETVRTLK